MNKNKDLLDSFIKYCEQHPEERFWQALRNWSEMTFILASKTEGLDLVRFLGHMFEMKDMDGVPKWGHVRDTFYWENKNN